MFVNYWGDRKNIYNIKLRINSIVYFILKLSILKKLMRVSKILKKE